MMVIVVDVIVPALVLFALCFFISRVGALLKPMPLPSPARSGPAH